MDDVPSAKCLTGFSKAQSGGSGMELVFQLAIPAPDTGPLSSLHTPALQEAALEAQSNRSLLAKS